MYEINRKTNEFQTQHSKVGGQTREIKGKEKFVNL
jgi:hypothetical protein